MINDGLSPGRALRGECHLLCLANVADEPFVIDLVLDVLHIQALDELADFAVEALPQDGLVLALRERFPRQLDYVLLSRDVWLEESGLVRLTLLLAAEVTCPNEQLKVLLDPQIDRVLRPHDGGKG